MWALVTCEGQGGDWMFDILHRAVKFSDQTLNFSSCFFQAARNGSPGDPMMAGGTG